MYRRQRCRKYHLLDRTSSPCELLNRRSAGRCPFGEVACDLRETQTMGGVAPSCPGECPGEDTEGAACENGAIRTFTLSHAPLTVETQNWTSDLNSLPKRHHMFRERSNVYVAKRVTTAAQTCFSLPFVTMLCPYRRFTLPCSRPSCLS